MCVCVCGSGRRELYVRWCCAICTSAQRQPTGTRMYSYNRQTQLSPRNSRNRHLHGNRESGIRRGLGSPACSGQADGTERSLLYTPHATGSTAWHFLINYDRDTLDLCEIQPMESSLALRCIMPTDNPSSARPA